MDFSASHRIWRGDWDERRNRRVFGLGASPIEHGHNYTLEVTLRGPVDDETGMLVDLKGLKEVMEREVGRRLDHRNLNQDTDFFDASVPTAENLARVIYDLLDRALPGLVYRVRLAPTEDLCVEVTG